MPVACVQSQVRTLHRGRHWRVKETWWAPEHVLTALEKRQISCPCWNSNPWPSSP